MDFENATHGVSFSGMTQYKSDLKMGVFIKIKDAIRSTEEVQEAVKSGWVGTAADNFIYNINNGADKMLTEISNIEDMLMTELDGIASQIGDMDENLVEKE